jgi:hypothetical protein
MKHICGCCEGIRRLTPLKIENRPGLSALSYRVGTHSSFLETMLADLSYPNQSEPPCSQELQTPGQTTGGSSDEKIPSTLMGLKTRRSDDPAIALLDAWATVADVLTFYQERIANEGFLRTAIERRSVLELAKLVGYRLRPGVASSVYLAFTVTGDGPTEVPLSARSQSIPATGEMPQTFETSDKITARTKWSKLKPRTRRPQFISESNADIIETLYFKGISTNLKPNDLLLLPIGIGFPRTVVSIQADLTSNTTKAMLQRTQNPDVMLASMKAAVKRYLDLTSWCLDGSDKIVVEATDVLNGFEVLLEKCTSDCVNQAINTLRGDTNNPGILQSLGNLAKKFRGTNKGDQLNSAIGTLEKYAANPRSKKPDDMLALMKAEIDGFLDLTSSIEGNSDVNELNLFRASLEKCSSDCVDNAINTLLKSLESLIQTDIEQNAGRTRIGDWLESAVDTLSQYADDLSRIAGTASKNKAGLGGTRKMRFRMMTTSKSPSPLTSGLSSVLKPLLKAPSLQPPNSIVMDRPVSRIYGAGSDMGPKIEAAINQGIGNDLYVALANAQVTAQPELSSVPVLGLRASPYGHNAPKMPIMNENGVVVGYSEWPLIGSIRIAVLLKPGVGNFTSARMEVKRKDRTYIAATETIPSPSGIDFGDGITASIEEKDIAGDANTNASIVYTITFKGFVSPVTIIVTVPHMGAVGVKAMTTYDAAPLTVLVDAEIFENVYLDTAFSRARDGHRMEVSRNFDTLFISNESPLNTAIKNVMFLDAKYDSIIQGSWIVIKRPKVDDPSALEADPRIFRAKSIRDVSRNDYGFSGDTTRIDLEGLEGGDWLDSRDLDISVLRGTEVYAQSGSLELADEPIDPVDEPVCGDTIELDGIYDGLETGRWLIVSGERLDIASTSGVTGNELVMIAGVSQDVEKVYDPVTRGMIDRPGDTNHTYIKLANSLAYVYKRDTLTIYGNVSNATQGETKSEVLGSGDASKSLQSFTLHQSPLTYVSAPNPTGINSTLQVRVNDILWKEVDNLVKAGPKDRVYVTEIDDDAKTKIIFGNGAQGARPPTGTENIRATYRAGMGSSGNVQAGQISQLMTRPPGITEVVNPIRASGGADREELEQARSNTPLALMALDRLISVQDYADFTRTFAGIGKAVASKIQNNRKNIVYVTIAGAGDIPIDKGSDLYRNLVKTLHDRGDIGTTVMVEMRDLVLLLIKAHIKVIDGYLWETVEPNIRAALHDAFGFDRRDLNRIVLQSEVISIIQGVEGVAYVDLDILEGLSSSQKPEDIEKFLLELKDDAPPKPAQLVILSSSPSLEDTLILQEVKI